jgi:hypothetical protein
MSIPRNSKAFFLLPAFLTACGGGGSGAPPPPITGPTATASVPTATPVGSPLPGSSNSPAPTSTPTGAGPTPTPAPTPPAAEASTYARDASDLAAYSAAVNAQCLELSPASTRFDTDLLQANGSYLVSVLPGETVAQAQTLAAHAVTYAVAVHKNLPGVGFMINPSYPLMVKNQANAPAWWPTSTNYPVVAAYYAALAQGLTQNGISYDVEDNLVFPSYSGQNYSGVSIGQLEAGVAENGSNVLTVMSPGYENLASEPLTLSENTGQPSLNTTAGYEGYTAAVRAALIVPPGSVTQIGAGSADWSSPSYLSAIETVPDLDYYDLHLYPPDVLTTPGGGIAQVDSLDPAVSGKPGVITENWNEKDAGDAGNYGASQAPELEQQDTYSFWAPLDAQYITTTMKLARCEKLALVNFWYTNELFAYLDYSTASTMTPTQAQSAEGMAGYAAASAGTLSASGQAFYTGLTGMTAPNALRRGFQPRRY